MSITRREFMVGCSSAIAAMIGGRIGGMVFAAPGDTAVRDTLVVVFLRGGCDGLSLVAPTTDPNYIINRGALRVSDSGTEAGLSLGGWAGIDFRLHPKAAGLHELYTSQHLAVVHACGLTNGTRSHFDAMDYMERGTPDNKNTGSGWLTRHLQTVAATGLIPAVASSASVPASLLGSANSIALTNINGFKFEGHWKYGSQQEALLRSFYNGSTSVQQAGTATLETAATIQSKIPRDQAGNPLPYEPEEGVEYPSDYYVGGLSDSLKTIAQIIKLDLGLQIATVDYGGWDTHESQQPLIGNQIDGLSRTIHAFYNDLANYHSRLTVVVMSEFGRRLKANQSGGTDHGHGNVALVLGGNVNGGSIYGNWPGLAAEQLDNGVDLAITTDYRSILSEIVVRRLANARLGYVFPGLETYNPLGLVRGTDLDIDWSRGAAHQVFLPLVQR